jgi:16S rRNA (cytosine967-C5)-methyltransferase
MTDPLYVQPSLNQRELGDVVFPQNFPSMVVAHVLNPTSGDVVLDMCAGPGGKMTHLATLMGNKGKLIALDKSVGKTSIMKSHVDKFQLKNVTCYTFDATKCCSLETTGVSAVHHPPFPIGSFDKILLDAPCSGFGQRPQFKYSLSLARFKSYQTYQRSLLHQSTC